MCGVTDDGDRSAMIAMTIARSAASAAGWPLTYDNLVGQRYATIVSCIVDAYPPELTHSRRLYIELHQR